MQVVLVEWVDAVTWDNWAEVEAAEQSTLKTAFAAGFLISDNTDKVTIALLSAHSCGAVSSWVNIPKPNIKRMEVLKEIDWKEYD